MSPRAQSLGEGLWRLALRTPTLPPATATNTLVAAGDRVAVIEPATPHDDERAVLDEVLERLAAEGRRVSHLLVTHHHSDHIGDLRRLRDRWGAPILAHAETAARLSFEVDQSIDEGEVIDLGQGRELHFVFTPGHAPGHLVIELPADGLAHVGDLVAGEGTILIDPRDDGDMGQYLDSLRRMRARSEGMRWVPAHGPVQDEPGALADYYIGHRLGREAKILASFEGEAFIDEGELLARSYDDKPAHILPLARGALEAHLQKLIAENKVQREGARLRRLRHEDDA